MNTAKYIGRVGALAVALGVGFAATLTPGVAQADATNWLDPPPDRTALIMSGTSVPTPDDYLVGLSTNHFIVPTHPGQDFDYVPVTTPQEWWPATGFARLIGLVAGPPSIWGPGGAGWPDVPLWKQSGLFDLTIGQSLTTGVADLETAMAAHGDNHLTIFGLSQGSVVADMEKRKLAEQYPKGTKAPDIDFVFVAGNFPNGGIFARFPGIYVPLILDVPFSGAAPTDTQFDTVMIYQEYDGLADFPLYPLNLIATVNALLGGPGCYVHCFAYDLSLPNDPTESPAYRGTHGDASYYFFENPDLPLFGPLRTLGVPESLIDVVEPFFRVIVDTAYDRSIPLWEPTPARLIPPLNPATVAADLVSAVGQGITNALAIFSPPAPLSIPEPQAVRMANQGVADTTQSIEQVAEADPATVPVQVAETAPASLPKQMAEADPATLPRQVAETAQASLPKQMAEADPATLPKQVTTRDPAPLPEQGAGSDPAPLPKHVAGSDPATSPAEATAGDRNTLQESETDAQQTKPKTASTSDPAKKLTTRGPILRGPIGASDQKVRDDADEPATHGPAASETAAGPSSDDDSPDDGGADGS